VTAGLVAGALGVYGAVVVGELDGKTTPRALGSRSRMRKSASKMPVAVPRSSG
jgi:hypothetical protein